MRCTKTDLIIGIAAFIILAIFFSLQPPPLPNLDYITESESTGSGTQTAGSDSEIMLPSGGDTPVEQEDIEQEYVESPQTGSIGVWQTRIFAILVLAASMTCCIVTNNKHIGSWIK